MNWLLGLLNTPIGKKILYWLGSNLWTALASFAVEKYKEIRQAIINKKNVEQYKEDVKNPDKPDEEVMQDGEDLLNGRKH